MAILALAILCHGTGRVLIERLPSTSAALRAAIATGLGFGLFGQALFALGSVGALTRPAVFALLLVMAIAGVRYVRELWLLLRRTPVVALAVLFAGSALTFLRALYPPIGYDATMYHLPYARLFAEAGSLVYAGFLRFPVFPQLNEMLFTASLLVADDVTAQLTQWLCFVVTAAAIAAIARAAGSDLRSALFASAVWCSVPLASYLGSQAYIDCGLTMAVTLAFAAWMQWRATAHAGWALAIGAFAGMAAATKYHGLFFVVFFGVAILAARSPQRARVACLFLLGALIMAAPWYLRIAAWTGNPLFPYFGGIFGANDWGLTLYHSRYRMRGSLLYDLQIWVPLLAVPAAAGALINRRVRFLFLGAVSYTVAVLKFDARFLIVGVPLFAICAAAVVARIPRKAAAALVVVALLPGIFVGWRDLRRLGGIPRTAAAREAFLERHVRPYRALRFLEKTAGPGHTVYAYNAAEGAYYWPGRYLGDLFGPYRNQFIGPLFRQPDRLARRLRSFGADYLLVDRGTRFEPSASFELIYQNETERLYRIASAE